MRGYFYYPGWEVKPMMKNANAASTQDEDTMEEIIGILTAISIVSKRLAKKLALLEKPSSEEVRRSENGTTDANDTHTGKSKTI